MTAFLEENQLLDLNQSGFRQFMNTQTALLNVLDEVKMAADERQVTLLVLFDMSKAFDCVDHMILLDKLRTLGLSSGTCDWFKSYLTGRRQAVLGRDGKISKWVSTSCGVPQGSIVGPLLFICYLFDIPFCFLYCLYMSFADDLQKLLSFLLSQFAEAVAKINADIVRLCDWAVKNKLKLNESKTQVIVLGTKKYINSIDFLSAPKIVVGGVEIEYSTIVKNLGVFVDSKLTWQDQVQNVIKKSYAALYQLKKNKDCLNKEMRKKLVKSLVCPT